VVIGDVPQLNALLPNVELSLLLQQNHVTGLSLDTLADALLDLMELVLGNIFHALLLHDALLLSFIASTLVVLLLALTHAQLAPVKYLTVSALMIWS
jgi:hypothetical protein